MSDEINTGLPSPELRTQQFFDQQYTDLAENLVGMTIAVPGTQNRIVVTGADAYEKASNEKAPYKPVLAMEPGTLAAIDYPFRRAVLPLLAAREGDGNGACVRISGATVSENGKIVKVTKGTDILQRLGIPTGSQARLAFMDPSETLFVVTSEPEINDSQKISSAGDELERAFDEIGK